jgi:hypothetical protein
VAIAQNVSSKDKRNSSRRLIFSDSEKEKLFIMWFNADRPTPAKFFAALDKYNRPSVKTLRAWMNESWLPRAEVLDKEAMDKVNQQLVAKKVEMFQRHIAVAKKMQNKALDILDAAQDISSNTAVRMLVEGVRIERESIGVPAAFEKYRDMSDEQLIKEFQEMVKKSPSKMITAESEDSE